MKELWTGTQVVIATMGGFLGWFLGGLDGFLYMLIAIVVIDYLTGVMCAIVDKELSSNVGFKGLFRKILIFVMVGIGHLVDTHIISDGSVLRTAVIFCYLSNEGMSLLENAAHIGLPVPEKLKDVLAQLHNNESIEKGEEATEDNRGDLIYPPHPEAQTANENEMEEQEYESK